MKKALSVLLATVFAFSCINLSFISVNAITDYTTGETEDGICYRIDNETDELTVTWADFSTTDLVIPAYIDGRPVTTIGDNFLNDTPNPNLRSVVIPDTVTRIRFNAFGNCINLESVVMSENIEYVEEYAFSNTALTNNEDKWENGALYLGKFLYGVSTDCSGEFIVKDGTRVIGTSCFCNMRNGSGCERITNIVIPDTVISIGIFAFYNCKALTSINIPDSVKYIRNVAFSGCTNLSEINIDASSLTYVGQNILRETAYYYDESNWQNDVLYLDTAAICGTDDIKDIKIKDGTEIIADYAFGCRFNATSVELPDSLRIICPMAFDDLHALTSIELPEGLEYIANNAFDGCDLLTELDIPFSVNYIGLFAFNRTDMLEKLIIRNPHCTIIDNHEEYAGGAYSVNANTTVYGEEGSTAETFANNNGVNFVTLFSQSGTTGSTCTWTFDNVSGTLTISNTSTFYDSISNYSYGGAPWFSFRESVKTVIVEGRVSSVGSNAFAGCDSLEYVYMPEVNKIGDSAFEGCASLKNVELSSKNNSGASIGKNAFSFCTSLTKIVIPFSSVTIGEKAFYYCENLNTLGIYNYLTIGDNAFSYCSNLSSIYMLNNGGSFSGNISNNAFTGVKADVYCYLSNTSYIQKNRFGGEFTYPNDTSGLLGYNAYWDYDQSNETLTISGTGKLFEYTSGSDLPWMVYNYGGGYTYGSNIKTIIIEDGITEIPSYSFEYMRNVESVNLPNTLLRFQPNAFNDCEALTEITLPASLEYVNGHWYWYRCPNLNDVYYIGTEEEWNEIYDLTNTNTSYRITPYFLVYHPATQSCTVAGYPAHYEFDGTSNTTFYDLNKVAIPTPVPSKLNHHFNGYWSKDANSHWHTCTLCGSAVSEKADHVYDNACDKICNICGYIRTIEHNYSTDYTSDENSHWRACTVCGDKTDFGSHVWDEGKVTKAPSCTDTGIRTHTCSVCKKTRTEAIPANGHSYIETVIPPTYTNKGYTTHCCENCGYTYIDNYIDAIEPTTAEPTTVEPTTVEPTTAEPTTVEPTTVEPTTAEPTTVEPTTVEPTTEHNHFAVADKGYPATCTETGLTEGSHCSVCGEIIKAQEVIPASGHKWDEGIVTKEPDFKTEGEKLFTCTSCGKTKVESIPAVTENIVELKGVLKSDFIANNPENIYVLSGNLEIAENVTFSVQNGVKVFGDGNELNVYGIFNANNAMISDTKIIARNKNEKPCSISIINCSVTGGNLIPPTGNSTHCNLTLKNSSFSNIDRYTYIWYPASDVYIEGNVFRNCGCISVGSRKNVYIRYNSFYDFAYSSSSSYNHKIVIDWAQYGATNCFFEYNNVYNEKEYEEIVGLQPGYDNASMTAQNNYWGTSDISKIQSYILDINLDYSCAGEVEYLPIKKNEIDISHYEHEEVIDKGYPPTCTEKGLSDGSHCSVCGEIIKAQEIIPATGHTTVIDKAKPATCTETGLTDGSHCSVCGEIIKAQEVIPATGHTEVIDKGKAPTCTETGLTEGSHCSVCGEIIKAQEVIPATDHTEVIDKGKATTCTETGLTDGAHCSVCGEIIKAQEVIPATGHTEVIDKGKAPTCTETGLTDGSHCSVCGEVTKAQEIIPATGHTWDNGTVTKAADCHHEGEMTYCCSECHEKRTEVIPMLEHQWDDGTITKEPTYTDPGEIKYTCSLCGDTRTESIPCKEKKGKLTISNETVRAGDEVTVKLYLDENPGITALSININFPNKFILKDVQYMGLFPNQPSSSPMNYNPFTISWASPTSTDIDNTGLFAVLTFNVGIDVPLADYPITVSYNAENVFDSAFVNVPLDIENGTVSVLKPTPGDVNRDGNINMKDLVLIQQLINRWDVQIVESAADVTDDGEINMKDLVLLQRYINGWEVVLK